MTEQAPSPAARDARLGRRAFLAKATAGIFALILPLRLRAPEALGLPTAIGRAPRPFARRLPIPKVLTGSDLTI
ncbi:MAG: hypothetical protein M3433_02285, partial [Actinomycetota bacterium]|nr:hypothetical protein [Actinomycetota bacterium]